MIDLREMTVLVVDDMESMYKSIRGIMRVLKFGRSFFYVENADEALKVLRKEQIDLLILDNNMPGMKGVELLEVIREDKQLRDLPVIMITADADLGFVTNAAEAEIGAYLLKPITVGLLKEKIPSVIGIANNPPPMLSHLKQAAKFEEAGDLDSAIQEAKLAMEANPKSSRPLREIGYFFYKKDDLAEAESYLLKAAEMNKIDVVAFQYLGDIYLKEGKLDMALKYLDKAMLISPRHFERGLNLGRLLIQKGMHKKAVTVFNKVFHLAKKPLELKEEIADFCIDNGATEYAAKLLKDVLTQHRDRADLHFKLGVIYEEAGKEGEALTSLSEAEMLDDKTPEIKIHLAKVYLAQGMIIRAERPLNAVLKVDPKNKEAKDLLRQCI